MKKPLSILLAVVITVCSLALVFAEQSFNVPTRESLGRDISGFKSTDLDGNPVDGSVFMKATITVMNMWATWGGPCMDEMPHIQALHEYYSETPETDVQFIGVITNDPSCGPADAQEFLEQNNYTWPNIVPDPILNSAFDSGAVPQTLIVDSSGYILEHITGAITSEDEWHDRLGHWLDVITNHYGQTLKVTFMNGVNNEVIATKSVGYGYPLPEPPETPSIAGHTFSHWELTSGNAEQIGDGELSYVIYSNVTVTAVYIAREFEVRFLDGLTNEIMDIQQVEYGKPATAPTPYEHEGYSFVFWDNDFSSVKSDLTVRSVYVQTGCTPPPTPTPSPSPTPSPTPTPTPTPKPTFEPTPIPTPTSGEWVVGDADGSGTADMRDALLIARHALKLETLPVESLAACDVDNDRSITIRDALTVIRMAMGIE